jgi:hypothetical protein
MMGWYLRERPRPIADRRSSVSTFDPDPVCVKNLPGGGLFFSSFYYIHE